MPRTIVVSGGGTGIGRATASAFAREGDQVFIVGRRADVLEGTAGELRAAAPGAPPPVTVVADLGEVAGAERARDEIAARAGAVDVLVNAAGGNAALGTPERRAEGQSPLAAVLDAWTGNFRSNVLTAVLLTEALRPLLRAPGGRVVLVSSIAAYRGSGSGSYGAAKAALHPYAFDLSRALGPGGITVNVVAPGYVEATEFFRGALPAERREALVAETHDRRAGTPGDVAATILWLASPEAGHVTAQVVQVNGGAQLGR